jgi:predicted nucleic acid-binding protein
MVDTSVLVAGIVWPRWPYQVLQHAVQGDFQLVLSPTIIEEATRKFAVRFPAYQQEFASFLRECGYEPVAEPAAPEVLVHRGLMRDVTDVPIALAAIRAGVDVLVSEDKDFTIQNETTAELHRHLTVMLSGTFLRQVMGWTSEELEAIRHRTWAELEDS